uniref:DH domain-containing protein n=1 Tax=Haemonchus contortus TaxID=6289 RepID=A0A6F7NM40_HAECO
MVLEAMEAKESVSSLFLNSDAHASAISERKMGKEHNLAHRKTVITLGSSVPRREEWLSRLKDATTVRVKHFSSRTKYLVAGSVTDSLYRRAVALGILIVSQEFVERCQRLEPQDDIERVAEDCRLPRFAGLTIAFLGFNDEIIEDHARTVESNGGHVTTSTLEATHVVVAPDVRPPASCHGKYLVTMDWFQQSMDLGWCANEKCFEYTWVEPAPRLRPRNSFLKFQRRRREECSAKKYKRYQLCLELFKTEVNCLKASDFLVRLFEENIHVPTDANDIMFGVYAVMRKAHDKIVQRMGQVLDTWNDDSTIGDIFVEESSLLTEAYTPYFHVLETSLQYLKENRKKNAKFNAFIVDKERDRSLGKQKVEYLLNVPFQQITSRIPASLKEIRNQTTSIDPDYEPLGDALSVIDRMLVTINESKRVGAESEAIFKKIDDLPSHILRSPQQFVCALQFLSIPNGHSVWNTFVVELLLFKNCLLMTEKLGDSVTCGAFLRRKTAKTMKFIEHCDLIRIRAVRIILNSEDERILVIVVRNPTKDAEWCVQIVYPDDMINQFLMKLVEEVFLATGRRIPVDVGCSAEFDDTTLNDSRFSSATSKVLRWVTLRKSRRSMSRSITTAAAAFEQK